MTSDSITVAFSNSVRISCTGGNFDRNDGLTARDSGDGEVSTSLRGDAAREGSTEAVVATEGLLKTVGDNSFRKLAKGDMMVLTLAESTDTDGVSFSVKIPATTEAAAADDSGT